MVQVIVDKVPDKPIIEQSEWYNNNDSTINNLGYTMAIRLPSHQMAHWLAKIANRSRRGYPY